MTARIFAPDSVRTYSELEREVVGVAEALRQRGAGPGVRVMLKAGNSAGYVSTLFALMHVGASIVLVDQQERPEQTRRIAQRASVKLIIADEDAPLADVDNTSFIYELLIDAPGFAPAYPRVSFADWCELPDSLLMWSSGSTGEPKGIVKNGGRFLRNLQRNADQVGHTEQDVLLPLLPFSHQYGISMVGIAWLTRCSLVIAPYRRPDRAMLMAGQCGATVVDATPATYRSMLNILRKRPQSKDQLRAVRMFCSGAAPLDAPLVDAYVEEFGLPLLDSYGSTEAGNVAFATPENPVGCGLAMPGLAVEAVDDEDRPLPAGEVGELIVRTPDILTGYLAEDGSIDPVDQETYRSGDFGYLDPAGNVFVLGRKFAVHRNGFTLYPEIIERTLSTAGCSAKLIALPDEQRGVRLTLFVEDEQLREPAHWRPLVDDVLAESARPNRIRVIERFPLNRNGKPDRGRLTELATGTGE